MLHPTVPIRACVGTAVTPFRALPCSQPTVQSRWECERREPFPRSP